MSVTNEGISILVAIYNADLDKLKLTVDSILNQKYVTIQIVFVDDGSKQNLEDWIKHYLKNSFIDYLYVRNEQNQGTVKNFYSGIELCKYDLIKCFSPGDYFVSDSILFKWITFMKDNDCEWSFANAICYKEIINGKMSMVSGLAHPNDIKPYINKNYNLCQWNYVVLQDLVLGANTICKKDILNKYLGIIVNKVIYCEDNVYYLMMFDGIIGRYFNINTIFYEIGTGISTQNSTEWNKRISLDFQKCVEIMKLRIKNDHQKRMYLAFTSWHNSKGLARVFKRVLVKDGIRALYLRKFKRRMTDLEIEKGE